MSTEAAVHQGDPGSAIVDGRCGAMNRHHTPASVQRCGIADVAVHGGKSTGPRTPEGLEASRRARLTHGYRSQATRELLATNRRRWRELLALLDPLPVR